MDSICNIIYFITVFLFGAAASLCFTGVPASRRNLIRLALFCALDGMVQIFFFVSMGQAGSQRLYPLIVHLPLILFIALAYRCDLVTSIVSVLTAYMCCQIPLWCALLFRQFSSNKVIYTVIYVCAALIVLYILYHYEASLTQHFIPQARQSMIMLGILPFCYYVFDYITTTYTDLLYTNNRFIVQFMPSVCCFFYFVFIIYYYRRLEAQDEAERLAESLHMQLEHAATNLNHLRTMQAQAVSYRHDMRHHFTYLQALAATGNIDKVTEYIQSVQTDLDEITPQRFCANELINLVLSAYNTRAESEGITLQIHASVPENLSLSDTKLCAIISNALENALHATAGAGNKTIQVKLAERNQALLIQISNPFTGTVTFRNGMPLSGRSGHGIGTKNIAAIAESYHGQYQFFVKDQIFTIRVLLPLPHESQ